MKQILFTYGESDETVEIEILANSPMLPMMTMMLSNPAMMSGTRNTQPCRCKKAKGMKKVEGNTTEITILLAGQIMIKVVGKKLKKESTLTDYLDAIDMPKLKEALL